MFRKRHPEVGAPAGTLVLAHGSERTTVEVMTYDQEHFQHQPDVSVTQLQDLNRDRHIIWIDVCGSSSLPILTTLAEEFDICPLAMENVVNIPQRPKAETYNHQQLIIVHAATSDQQQSLQLDQYSVIFGDRYVITFHQQPFPQHRSLLAPIKLQLQRKGSRLRAGGSDHLVYCILDAIVDSYYPMLEQLGEQLETLERSALADPHPDLLTKIHATRNQMLHLRRSIWPQRESLERLLLGDCPFLSRKVRRYLRDSLEHCGQIVDVVEMYRESASGLVNTYMSAVAHRSNEIMKVLTIMSSIFVPLTFIAGIYGMNFQEMPELSYDWAYPAVWAVMISVAVTMICFFYNKGWLGQAHLKYRQNEEKLPNRVSTTRNSSQMLLGEADAEHAAQSNPQGLPEEPTATAISDAA